jgi:tetratricopeptide (TPR) repeat protein
MKIIKIIIISVVAVFALLLIIGLLLPQSEIEKIDNEKVLEAKKSEQQTPNPINYILTKEDTTGDVLTIINKLGSLFMNNKLEEVVIIASGNISRFKGIDRADILNQRAGAYYALGQQEKALKDYEETILLDPSNSSNITNIIETFASLGNKQKAIEYLNKLKKTPHVSQFDIQVSEEAIDKIK